jgi:DNA-binding CsgD family transcriptional regulator
MHVVQVTGQLSNQVRERLTRLRKGATRPDLPILHPDPLTTKCKPTAPTRRRQHRLSPSEASALIEAVTDGAAIGELARQYGIDRSTVLDHVNRPQARRHAPALNQAEVEVAAALYRAGQSFREVGVQLGVHASTVRQYLLREGVKPRDRRGR